MFRRHFFLIIAVAILAVMGVVAAFKIMAPKPGAGGAPGAMAGGARGGPGGAGGPGGPGRGGPGGMMATTVTIATAQPRVFVDRLEVLGVAKGRQSVTLTSNTAEMVDRVRFRPGDAVRQGQVLIELRRQEEDAGIEQARANVDLAKVTADRWNQLAKQGVAAQATADQYQAAYLTARASLGAAEARESDRVIKAPFSGVVGLSDIAPGALISPGTAIVTLDDLSLIRVDFDVPDRYLALVREGTPIQATTDAYPGERYGGKIAKLDTRIDERSRSFKARAEFPNPGGRLKPGMLVRVGIDRGTRTGIGAPEAAVQFSGGQAYVYVLTPRPAQNGQGQPGPNGQGAPANKVGNAPANGGPNGSMGGGMPGMGPNGRPMGQLFTASQRPVITGLNDCGFLEIREGLQAGDKIVGDGVNKVTPNATVRGVPAGMHRPGTPGAPGGAAQAPGQGAPTQGGPQGAAGARPTGTHPGPMAGGQRPGAGAPGAERVQRAGACANQSTMAHAGSGAPAGAPVGVPVSPGSFGGARPVTPRGSAAAAQ